MKTIIISQNGKEISRFIPQARTTVIGRSPSCDVVIRTKHVKPYHFLVEWIGEGSYDPEKGMWTIIDLSQRVSSERHGEGAVLSSQSVNLGIFEFKIIVDSLAESSLIRGALSRKIEELRDTNQPLTSSASVLEVIYYRKDIEAIINIRHFDRQKYPAVGFPNLPQFKYVWPTEGMALGALISGGEKTPFQVFNRGQEVTALLAGANGRLEVKSSDFITIETEEFEYHLRMVTPVYIKAVPFAWLRDATIRAVLILTISTVGLAYWMQQQPPKEKLVTIEPPRVATVEVKELSPAEELIETPPPVPPEVEATPAETEPVQEMKVAAPSARPAPPIPMKSADKETKASAPSVKNVDKTVKTQLGLNTPAPITNVNQVGLLGKLKGGRKGEKVSADMIINKGVVSDTASGSSGFVVAQPPAGEIGHGKKGGGSHNTNSLAGASTTLKNSGVVDGKSAGALAIAGGVGKYSSGLSLGGKEGEAESAGSAGDGNTMDVVGGLDKEAIRRALRENRRAVRACYENALLSRKGLEGRITLRWRISPQGPVETIFVQTTTMNLASFENCVLSVVKGITFPVAPNKLPTTVIYPFVFQGKNAK